MDHHRIDFKLLDWESPIPGMRQKAYTSGGRRIRLIEYTEKMEPHWCDRGHYGYILEGRLETEFDDRTEIFEAGDGVFIPEGKECRHRGRVLGGPVLALFVEEI